MNLRYSKRRNSVQTPNSVAKPSTGLRAHPLICADCEHNGQLLCSWKSSVGLFVFYAQGGLRIVRNSPSSYL